MARSFLKTSSEYLSVANAVVTATPLTMAGWFYLDTSDHHDLMNITETGANNEGFRITARNTDDIVASVRDGGAQDSAVSTTTYSTSTWHHFAGVYTSSTSRHVLLDGGGKGSETTSSTPTLLDTTSLGAYNGASIINPINGDLAEIGIWNAALTDSEVASLAAGYSPLFIRPGNLVAYWPLGGKVANDSDVDIVGGYDMTAYNTPTTADHPPGIIYPSGPLLGAIEALTPFPGMGDSPSATNDDRSIFPAVQVM